MHTLSLIPYSIFLGFSLTTIPLLLLQNTRHKSVKYVSHQQINTSTYLLLFATIALWASRIAGINTVLTQSQEDFVIAGWNPLISYLITACLGIIPLLFLIPTLRSNTYTLILVSLCIFIGLHCYELITFFTSSAVIPGYNFSFTHHWGASLLIYTVISLLLGFSKMLFKSLKSAIPKKD